MEPFKRLYCTVYFGRFKLFLASRSFLSEITIVRSFFWKKYNKINDLTSFESSKPVPTYFENIIKSLKKIRLQRVLCIIFVSPTAVCTCNAVLGHACSTGVTRAWWLHNRYDSSSWLSHSLTFTYSITFNASYFVLKKFVLRNHIPSQLTSAYDVWGWFCFIRAGLKAGCRYNKTFRESLGRVSTQNGRYAIVFSLHFSVLKLRLFCFDWRLRYFRWCFQGPASRMYRRRRYRLLRPRYDWTMIRDQVGETAYGNAVSGEHFSFCFAVCRRACVLIVIYRPFSFHSCWPHLLAVFGHRS